MKPVEAVGGDSDEKEGSEAGVDGGEVGGESVGQRHSAHLTEISHDVPGTVGQDGRHQGDEGDEEAGPGGQVGVEQVVDVYPGLGGEGQVHQEDQNQHTDRHQGLQLGQARSEAAEAAGDDLDVTDEAGDGDDAQQDEVKSGPEPAVAQTEERLVQDGDGRQPEPLSSHGPDHLGTLLDVGVPGSQESQGEQEGEEDPDDVRDDDDGDIPDQVVSVLVTPGVG